VSQERHSAERAKLFKRLLRESAKQLKASVTDYRVQLLASLRLDLEDTITARLDGEDVDRSETRRITEEIAKFAPAPTIEPVRIDVVDSLIGVCVKCGHEHTGYKAPERPAAAPRPAAFNSNPDPGPADPDGDNVVPIKPPEKPKPRWHDLGYVPASDAFSSDPCVKSGPIVGRDPFVGAFNGGSRPGPTSDPWIIRKD
jgi:hypothetical protein